MVVYDGKKRGKRVANKMKWDDFENGGKQVCDFLQIWKLYNARVVCVQRGTNFLVSHNSLRKFETEENKRGIFKKKNT
jgi:hypothetical protein